MNTCDSCKWWRPDAEPDLWIGGDDEDDVESVLRPCLHYKMDAFENWPDVLHYGGRYSNLQTGPKFGCIHWEEK